MGWHHGGNEQITSPPLPRDRHPSAGDAMPALPPHRRLPARHHQRDPDRALPPGTSRNARSCVPVTARGNSHGQAEEARRAIYNYLGFWEQLAEALAADQ